MNSVYCGFRCPASLLAFFAGRRVLKQNDKPSRYEFGATCSPFRNAKYMCDFVRLCRIRNIPAVSLSSRDYKTALEVGRLHVAFG